MTEKIFFYIFASMLIASAIAVISAKNPVHSVLMLVLTFFNAAALFVIIGAEYIAMTLVIVYVGAVAVLFLFVVMMLNVNFSELREGFTKYLPVGLVVALVMLVQIGLLFYRSLELGMPLNSNPQETYEGMTNAHAIGMVLYTDYALIFQVSGLILLVAMIGAIVLTHRVRGDSRKQDVMKQILRRREDAIEMVKVESGSGA